MIIHHKIFKLLKLYERIMSSARRPVNFYHPSRVIIFSLITIIITQIITVVIKEDGVTMSAAIFVLLQLVAVSMLYFLEVIWIHNCNREIKTAELLAENMKSSIYYEDVHFS